MATAKTLLAMVKYFEESSANAGIKPQEVRVKAKRLSDKTGLTWETVSNALKEEELGFIKDSDGYWSLRVNYVWRDVVKTFEADLPEAAKMSMWRTYPQISTPVGIKPDSTSVEVKKCNKEHVPDWMPSLDKLFTNRLKDGTLKDFLGENKETYAECLNWTRDRVMENSPGHLDTIAPTLQLLLKMYKELQTN